MPSIVNTSGLTKSHSVTSAHQITVFLVVASLVVYLSIGIVAIVYPVLVDRIKLNKEGKKTNTYFQFWASHIFLLISELYIVITTKEFELIIPIVCYPIVIIPYYIRIFDSGKLNTVFHFCCTWKYYKTVVLFISLWIFLSSITIFLFNAPNVIVIFYLYPVHTVIRLSFILNSALYINSAAALILYQCEKLFYSCQPNKDHKDPTYEEYRHKKWARTHNSFQLFGALLLLPVLLLIIVTINELLEINLNYFTNQNQLNLLLTLVSILLLFFGSWYKLDVFFGGTEEKSEKELLKEILQEKKSERKLLKEILQVLNHTTDSDGSTETGGGGQETNPASPTEAQDQMRQSLVEVTSLDTVEGAD